MIPGEIISKNKEIYLNKDKKTLNIKVSNVGDRPIQVGSHFHFFEVNRFLKFDREQSFGMRLNIPSGTSVRFEPGEEKEIEIVEIGGSKRIEGFNFLTSGQVNNSRLAECLENAKIKNFI